MFKNYLLKACKGNLSEPIMFIKNKFYWPVSRNLLVFMLQFSAITLTYVALLYIINI